MNSRAQENRIGIPLHANPILTSGIGEPGLFLRTHLFEQRCDIDTGPDELEIPHRLLRNNELLNDENEMLLRACPRGNQRRKVDLSGILHGRLTVGVGGLKRVRLH